MDTIAIVQVRNGPLHTFGGDWERSYRPLPDLFFCIAVLWMLLVVVWTLNTWSKRRWQTSSLQWVLTAIPAMKSLVMSLSFVFWYSCIHLKICSFWVAFGVFVSRIFFETACFVTFLLISYGYCIMQEQLSLAQRRSAASLTSLLYLILTGYKAAVPQFAVLIVFIYAGLLYIIMAHIAQNLSLLREQLQQIQAEGVHMMHNAVHTKYIMFRKFQGAMLAMVVAEILVHAQVESVVNEYWMRLLVREMTEVIIFLFIGWTFRSRERFPFFDVMPTSNSAVQRTLAPIYSVEMNEREFSKLDYKEWHIGVPTTVSRSGDENRPTLVIVQNPSLSDFTFTDFTTEPCLNGFPKIPGNFQPLWPNPSSSSISEHEGLQLRLRTTGELSKVEESVLRKGNHMAEHSHWESKSRSIDSMVSDSTGNMEQVSVDVRRFKNYAFVPFEHLCGDLRPLHSNTYLCKSLQSSVHSK
ncbi:uncharacterized protein [Physcomitrium patens]|uniref:Uncharacterized protein n=1 Tax=Physcomitrium patens TaxID=3218 RepID=A0A2K1IAX7_PHYPA|nr:uncharacterized protein LOC112278418 isoform X2 [Physcomitrium patens]PNR26424.1 hypothetical protein PHYPA_030999 [Physcomitrium patens]|eukprot:XP_024367654.1 uncharacterized protein LOC112278418 isoform X2 [Physcomitrella patens]